MTDSHPFGGIPTTTLADVLKRREQVMDIGLRPLWPAPRVAGPAYTVKCAPGDNLMLHAAIHRAPRGSIVVVEAGDVEFAVAGGNVCAVAQRHGIAAFVIDGAIRDIGEIREIGFPVFARGVIPIPGAKTVTGPLNDPVQVGGVTVNAGDLVVADEEGIVVIPAAQQEQVLRDARAKLSQESEESLDAWESAHAARVTELLHQKGYED